ncbi:MAG: cation-translocating P-type ATPase [Candidatus Bathyarchaeota archaeon]|nr:cation-translocating P-type ATPase [Candidatus Bathyarchaeota archaeon]
MVSRIKEGDFEDKKDRRIWIPMAIALAFTMASAALLDFFVQGVPLGFVIPLLNEQATVSTIIYYTTIVVAASYIGVLGFEELIFERRFSVEFLMATAAFGAMYLAFLFEAVTVLFLYSLAEYFEGYIQDRARRTVEKLSEFMPDKARIITDDGKEENVDVTAVLPGTTVLIRPGERIVLDGVITDGVSYVDQSLVTGESAFVLKKFGDNAYAGTLNTSGVLKISVSKKAGDTLVSRIVKLVIQSRKRKASIEKLVDRFAKFYVPIVISLALFTAFFMPSILSGSFEIWLYRALILLVISCPSAFIISVPATMFTAVTLAARRGVVIKGGVYVEKMDKIGAVLFDKTGTLTLGKPVVHCIKGVSELDEKALMYAAALEQFSNHPLAQAVTKSAADSNLNFRELDVKNVKEIPGKGIMGYVDGTRVIVGSTDLLKQYGSDCESISEAYENEKHSAVCVSLDETATSLICIIDDVREDAVRAVKALKEAGLHIAILTGDKAEIAQETAERIGIAEVYAKLFPEDKLKIIAKTREKHGLVAMVGDGVNDAPALAASDVGIAMGGGKVDVALESADIILVKDELAQIPTLHKLSKMTVRIAKQNIAVSLGVKLVLGALGLMGFTPLWFTVALGDDGLTMLTLLNTLRLTKLRF